MTVDECHDSNRKSPYKDRKGEMHQFCVQNIHLFLNYSWIFCSLFPMFPLFILILLYIWCLHPNWVEKLICELGSHVSILWPLLKPMLLQSQHWFCCWPGKFNQKRNLSRTGGLPWARNPVGGMVDQFSNITTVDSPFYVAMRLTCGLFRFLPSVSFRNSTSFLAIRWTWVWASSGSWWWTGKPGMLGSQNVGHDWATELTDWRVIK